MSAPVKFAGRTRYKPWISRATGRVVMTADEQRRLDAELLCERLSEKFIHKIRLMDDDQLLVLELLANGIDHHHDFLPDVFNEGRDPQRVISAARRFAAKRTRKPAGGVR